MKSSGEVTETALASSDLRTLELAMVDDEPLVLVASDDRYELTRPLRGDSFPIALPEGAPSRVGSEPGRILLDVEAPARRTLVELSCR